MGPELCQKIFLHLLRWSYGFIFLCIDVVYHIDWFVDIEKSSHPWDISHLNMQYDLLTYYWIPIASILLIIFASMFISDSGL